MEFHTRPSTWAGVVLFCLSAFTSQPSIAVILAHLALIGVIWMTIWLAHMEGSQMEKSKHESFDRRSSSNGQL